MKKADIYKFLYAVGGLLLIGFCVRLGVDYLRYDAVSDSAPFYVFVLERLVEFVLPSVISFIAGAVAKRKFA